VTAPGRIEIILSKLVDMIKPRSEWIANHSNTICKECSRKYS